jgi:hypothetical protein
MAVQYPNQVVRIVCRRGPPLARQPRKRQMNSAGFLRETVAPILNARPPIEGPPFVGVDESLNDPMVESMLRRLAARGLIAGVAPLWSEPRIRPSGERFHVSGSAAKLVHKMDGGTSRRDPAFPSTADEVIVALLVTHFLSYDRLCLLTADVKRNVDGIWWIAHKEVGPALQQLEPFRLGLLALCQRPGSQRSDYCAAVETRLNTRGLEAGLEWLELG